MKACHIITAALTIVGAAAAILIGGSGAERIALTPQATSRQGWNSNNYQALLPAPPPAEAATGATAPSQFSDHVSSASGVAESASATAARPTNYAELGVLPAI